MISNLDTTGDKSPLDNVEDLYQLSPMQQGMLFHTVYEPDSDAYFEQSVFTMEGDLDASIFERAWQCVVDRHTVLRSSFVWEDLERPVQVVQREVVLPLYEEDWRHRPPEVHDQLLQEYLRADRHRGFDLHTAPLIRLALFQTGDKTHKFVFSRHHIVLDRWSRSIVLKDVFAFYESLCRGEEPTTNQRRPYADYISWLNAQDHAAAESYWRGALEGFVIPTAISSDQKSIDPTQAGREFEEKRIQLSEESTTRLRDFAREHKLTLNTLTQAGWALLLSKYAREEDVLFGVTVAGRPTMLSGVESMAGLFINTLPLRVRLTSNPTVLTWLKCLQEQQLVLQEYEYCSLLDIHTWSEIPGGVQLFQSIVVFENLPAGGRFQSENSNLQVRADRSYGSVTGYPLTLMVVPGARLSLQLIYDRARFSSETIRLMLLHLETALDEIPADPMRRLSMIPLVGSQERKQLFDWNDTNQNYDSNICVHQLFELQASLNPSAIAVTFQDQQLTYAELNARANQLARHLRALGVGPETLVGIFIERSLEMVIGLLAILKAGGSYVPLDPEFPRQRLAFMIEDAGLTLLLTQKRLVTELPSKQARVVVLDGEEQETYSQENLVNEATGDNLAYVIYTSGSSGRPKGVAIAHHALTNFLLSVQHQPGLARGDVLLAVTTLSFDIAGLEIYLPLITGARLVIVDREDASDGIRLKQSIAGSGATVMQATPATWQMLINAGWQGHEGLKVLCGGEALSRELANELLARGVALWNMYGPTETTIWSTTCKVNAGDDISIGRPLANTQIYLLDEEENLVPIGMAGELHIGGLGLARGYLDRPDLTADRFVPNPFSDEADARLYKTGDLARYLANGDIEYLGRIDDQVKVRGFRIELGEIESILRQHPSISESVVIAREDVAGDKRLVAYVVGMGGVAVDATDLRNYLRERLPDYMLPAAIVALTHLPLTANGKVDRRRLPAPDYTVQTQDDFTAPRTDVEQLLTSIWLEVLKVPRVSINDNFFELGGHSLLAVSMISRVRDALNIDLKVRSLFEAPTVAGLARTCDRLSRDAVIPPIRRAERAGHLPLSFAQERLWFLDQLERESPFYNVPSAFRLIGSLDVESLRKAFDALTMRHEALRTTFSVANGRPVQVIAQTPAVAFSYRDLSNLARDLIEGEIRRRGYEEASEPFELQSGPLLRVKLLRLAEAEYALFINTHHIVSDGWSIGILTRELAALYEAFTSGTPPQLAKLPVQYVDYAIWQRHWLKSDLLAQQVSYWKRQLEGAPLVLELPKDRLRPAVQTFHGARRSARLSLSLTKALSDLSQREGVTMFMTLLAIYQTLLWRYSGQNDLVIGTPVAGRNSAEIEGLIGFFVNTLVMRSDLSGDPSFRRVLARVRETALEAYAHQDLPFEQLVDTIQPERSLSYTPLFQVALVFQNAPREWFKLRGLRLERIPIESRTSKFDLTLFATETAEGLNLAFEYNTDLFDAARIERMMGHLQKLMEAVVEHPDARIGELDILTESERERLLVEWNETRTEYPSDRRIHEFFEEQAETAADKFAIISEDEQLTYRELNRRANQLAHYLKKCGVGPEVLVGLCVRRSWQMVVGLLGILKAGGAYVPLDPAYPAERLRFMLEDANARLILTEKSLLKTLPDTGAEVLLLDTDWTKIGKESEQNPIPKPAVENLAYVIYTSGSSGKPKGVAIEHRSASALLAWARRVFTSEELEGVLASTSICFDLSVFELFLPLSFGGKVVLARDVLQLPGLAAANDVRLINTVPSAMVELLRLGGLPPGVRTVNLAGEPLSAELAEMIYSQPQIERVFDLYGPSEDTTYSTYAMRQPKGRATIGRPIDNTRVYLLDAHLKPVPVGVPGELYIGGAGLTRGYLNRPELTAKVFVPDPFGTEQGARLYKTGDLARYFADGNIEYLGRIDNQIKLRGFRIELGEIEEVIKKHSQVSEALVLARKDGPADQRLVAYVIPNRDNSDSDVKKTLQAEQLSQWQTLWNETYTLQEPTFGEDPTFNIVGWNNSYTGRPIPSEEMHEWVDHTVDKILSLHPQRVLEIGCGTGLLLFRIAPHCDHYHGTDLSKRALDYLRQQLSGPHKRLQNVTLLEQTADDFAHLDAQVFDTVILNSVVQYFPSVDYLVKVLEGAAKCLKPGGQIFLGDLRSLPLLRAFHTSVELHTAPSSLPLSELQRRVQKRIAQEKELVIDPAFFSALRAHLPQISQVDIQLKRGRYRNELTKFRYDVVLQIGCDALRSFDHHWLDWGVNQLHLADTRRLLTEASSDLLAIRGVPDARVASDFKALALLGSSELQTVGDLREAIKHADVQQSVEPEDFWALGKDLPYAIKLTWAASAGDGTFDAILQKRTEPNADIGPLQSRKVEGPWTRYANDPLLGKVSLSLQPALRKLLVNQLPEYMMPAEFIFLNAFPLTPNGKIDRAALPEFGQSRPELDQPYVAPRSIIEKQLANIWGEVLRREKVGINDNFFELGGHSLLATQVISRIREQFKLELPLRCMFESPTIASLASALVEHQQETKPPSVPALRRRRRRVAEKIEQL